MTLSLNLKQLYLIKYNLIKGISRQKIAIMNSAIPDHEITTNLLGRGGTFNSWD